MAADAYHAGQGPDTVIDRENVTAFPAVLPKLEMRELCGLYEVFSILSEQVMAFANQPRFEVESSSLLEDLAVELDGKMRAVVAVIKATKPACPIVREIRAKTLIVDAVKGFDNISEIAAVAAALAVPERH